MELTRRAMLGALGGLAVGGTVASVVGTSIAADPKMKRFDQANGDFGWKPHKLDPNVCAPVAYEGYWHKGYACGYGTFYGIVGMMGEQYGAPYSQFPFTMLEANKAPCMVRRPPSPCSGAVRTATPWSVNFSAGMKPQNSPFMIPATRLRA